MVLGAFLTESCCLMTIFFMISTCFREDIAIFHIVGQRRNICVQYRGDSRVTARRVLAHGVDLKRKKVVYWRKGIPDSKVEHRHQTGSGDVTTNHSRLQCIHNAR